MAYIPPKPIQADDSLAYFAALTVPPCRSAAVTVTSPAKSALQQMFGYYSIE